MWRQVVSNSPTEVTRVSKQDAYKQSLKSINKLLKAGISLSGSERNRCFLNTGGPRFANISSISGLDMLDDGRSLGLCDWDGDGDTDLLFSNRTGPQLRFMRNNTDGRMNHLSVRLQGISVNRDAIGSRVVVKLAGQSDVVLMRGSRAGDGFLSQSSKWLHFGLGKATEVQQLKVRWPDGQWESFSGARANGRYLLVQGTGRAEAVARRESLQFAAKQAPAAPSSQHSRTRLVAPLPLPALSYDSFEGQTQTLEFSGHKGTVLNLWASWCQPCIRELADFSAAESQLREAGLTVLALSVDGLGDKRSNTEAARRYLKRIRFPFPAGRANADLLARLEIIMGQVYSLHPGLPVPTSLLIDGQGRLQAIYQGTVELDTLLRDANRLIERQSFAASQGAPFEGRSYTLIGERSLTRLAHAFLEEGYRQDALAYSAMDRQSSDSAGLLLNIGASFTKSGDLDQAITYFKRTLELDPEQPKAHYNLGLVYTRRKAAGPAEFHLKKALEFNPDYTAAYFGLGEVYFAARRMPESVAAYRKAVSLDPQNGWFQNSLGVALARSRDREGAITHFELSLQYRPNSARTCFNLGRAYVQKKRVAEARDLFEKTLELQPDHTPATNELIWILAASQNGDLRDGKRALVLATGQTAAARSPLSLQLLASAQAELGRFEEALASIREALTLAKTNPKTDPRLISQLQFSNTVYLQGKPFRHPRY